MQIMCQGKKKINQQHISMDRDGKQITKLYELLKLLIDYVLNSLF